MSFSQSVPICLVLSAVGGVLEVIATALLAYPEAQEKMGITWSKKGHYMTLAGNITLQIFSSVFGNLFAPWFGPVSIVGPIFLAAQLVANMIVYGSLLGLESFSKDMRIGTYVIVLGAVLLPIVGPKAQEDQKIMELLKEWYASLWSAMLLLGMFGSAGILVKGITPYSLKCRIFILLVARVSSFTVNLTISKMMVLTDTMFWLIVSIILKVLSGAIMTFAIVIQSTAVPQATFVPLNATMNMLSNALTGIIIWEDWRVIDGTEFWIGYFCVFYLFALGNYLLLGDVNLFIDSNKQFGRRALLKRVCGHRNLLIPGDLARTDDNDELGCQQLDEELAAEGPAPARPEQQVPEMRRQSVGSQVESGAESQLSFGRRVSTTSDHAAGLTKRQLRRASSRKAWQSVFNVDDSFVADGHSRVRRHSIFLADTDAASSRASSIANSSRRLRPSVRSSGVHRSSGVSTETRPSAVATAESAPSLSMAQAAAQVAREEDGREAHNHHLLTIQSMSMEDIVESEAESDRSDETKLSDRQGP